MDMQDLTNSYAIQYLFKIKKLKSKEKIDEAINNVIKNNKGSNVYLKGNKYYLNNKYLKIKEITDDNADIYNLKVFQSKVDYTKESINFSVFFTYNLFFEFVPVICSIIYSIIIFYM